LTHTVVTLSFTVVQIGKYRREDKFEIQTMHKLNTTQKKQTMQNTAKQNYQSTLVHAVAYYDTQPRNEVGYNPPSSHGKGSARERSGREGKRWKRREMGGPIISHIPRFGF